MGADIIGWRNCSLQRENGRDGFFWNPVDGVFEELVFNYFCLQLPVKDSICDPLYQDFVSKLPSSNTSWHRMRGNSQQGGLASLTVPLKFEWICDGSNRYVDSAQMLGALFLELDNKAIVVGYTSFWMELVKFGRAVRNSRTLDEIRALLPMLVAMVPIAVNEGGIIVVDG